MDRPALPMLVTLVHGRRPEVVPLRHLPDWYAVAIPAGHTAIVVSPDANGPGGLGPAELEQLLEDSAVKDRRGVSYGIWTIRVTRGAWARLAAIKDILVDILSVTGILPIEAGAATIGDRARLVGRAWARRLLSPPLATENTSAGERRAPRPLYPVGCAAPPGNGEVGSTTVGARRADSMNVADAFPQEEA